MSGIAFKPEEATDALREFVGQIIETDYSLEPFGFKGASDIQRKDRVLGVKISTTEYDKAQYELVSVEPDELKTFGYSPEDDAILQYAIGCLEFAIDGEGSISISKSKPKYRRRHRYIPRVQVCNTNIAFLEKVQMICDGGWIDGSRRGSEWSKKIEYVYEMTRPIMKKWLPQLSLAVKEEQRKLILDFLALVEGRQGSHSEAEWCEIDSYYEQMKLLNSGVPIVAQYWSRYKWYPPSHVKKTKWIYFLEALVACGAMKDVSTAGKNDEERIQNFASSLLGMKFRWEQRICESMVREKGGFKKFDLMIPVEYLGKAAIEAKAEVRSVDISEKAQPGAI